LFTEFFIPSIIDNRGSLGFIQNFDQIPFSIANCSWSEYKRINHENVYQSFETKHCLLILSGAIRILIKSSSNNVYTQELVNQKKGLILGANQPFRIECLTDNAIVLQLFAENEN